MPEPQSRTKAHRRRRQRVVVRAPSSEPCHEPPPRPEVHANRRRPMPTLIGLGEVCGSPPDVRLGVWVWGDDESVDAARPLTLVEGVDDALARAYREEAELLLASGIFSLIAEEADDNHVGGFPESASATCSSP